MNFEIFPNPHDLSYGVADKLITIYEDAIKEKNFFTLCLSGGSSTINLYKVLAQFNIAKKIEWDKVFIFWGDERCLPIESPESNAGNAFHALLDHVPIPIDNIFTIPVILPPEMAAEKYEEAIRNFFRNDPPKFDLILLGMGEDGHTASIFPGSPIIDEKKHWVKEVKCKSAPYDRITLTPVIINQSQNIIFIVYGEEKKDALFQVTQGAFNPHQYPSQMVKQEKGNLYWYIDQAAGSLLCNKKQK